MHNLCFLLEEVEVTEGCLAGHSSSIPSLSPPHPQSNAANSLPPEHPKVNASVSGIPLDGDAHLSSPAFDAKSAGGDEGGAGGGGGGDVESVGMVSAKNSAKGGQRATQVHKVFVLRLCV